MRGCGEGGREGGRVGGRDDDEGKEVWVNPNTIGGERKWKYGMKSDNQLLRTKGLRA